MKTSILLMAAAAVLLPAPALAAVNLADGLNAMRELNLITLGDRNGSSEVEGKAYIGGALTGSIQVTQKTNNNGHGYVAGDYADLTVGGNAETWSAGSAVTGASTLVRIGGNSTGQATMNLAGGKTGHVDVGGTFNSGGFNPNSSKTVSTNVAGLATSIQSTTDQLAANLTGLSQALKALPGTAITDMNSALTFGSGGYTVFTMTDAQFNAPNVDFDKLFANFTATTDETIIINMLGTSFTELGNLNTTAINQKVIWNFADATSISLKGWHGSILAPNATLSNSSAIEGSVVTQIFNQSGEVHLGTYDGTSTFLQTPPPPAVPEPATWAMMLAGFGAVGSMVRRRRRLERLAAA